MGWRRVGEGWRRVEKGEGRWRGEGEETVMEKGVSGEGEGEERGKYYKISLIGCVGYI